MSFRDLPKFDLGRYSPCAVELIDVNVVPELGPGRANESMRNRLSALTIEQLFHPLAIRNRDMARCCLSGLWLLHDFLEESHSLSQEIQTTSGSYWHGIMHRREPDYGNAKYWFRRVGDHPIFPQLASLVATMVASDANKSSVKCLVSGRWDPYAFIDWCEMLARHPREQVALAEAIALVEWRLLFDYCWRQSVGEN